jgi:SAM-dependent methyltransferase
MTKQLKYSGEIYDQTAPFLNPAYTIAHEAQNYSLLKSLNGIHKPYVLDLGCGTGVDGAYLLEKIQDLHYVGIDRCDDFLSYAKQKLSGYGSRVTLIKGDIQDFESLHDLYYSKIGPDIPPHAIISAYTFHHFSPREKASLYRVIYLLLRDNGVFINTDLFCPLDRSLFQESLDREISNLKRGAKLISADILSSEIRDKLLEEWIAHYRSENRPTALEEDVEALNQAGFVETTQLFHQYQSRSILASTKGEINAAPYHQILGFLYSALGNISPDISEADRDVEYAKLFENNENLRKSAYSFFNLSGASFVVSDNLAGKFVMLQQFRPDETKDSIGRSVGDATPRFAMPIFEPPLAHFSALDRINWRPCEYNLFINNIFQIQRDHQGLRSYGERLTLTYEPEFLMRLPSGFADGKAANPNDLCIDDCYQCPADDLVRQIVLWRWIVWVISNFGESMTLADSKKKGFDDLYNAVGSSSTTFKQYFTDEFFDSFPRAFPREVSPEGAINQLDSPQSWADLNIPEAAKKWIRLRSKLDSTAKKNFGADIAHLIPIFFGVDQRKSAVIRKECLRIAKECHLSLIEHCDALYTFADALQLFHGRQAGHPVEALAPACAYFYYISCDGRPKDHVIISILRSIQSPLEYYVGEERRRHSAVVIGLATLNSEQGGNRRQYKLLQLRHFLRSCTDPLVDRIFIKSLKEAEQNSAAIRAEKVLEVSRYSKIGGVFILGSFDRRITFYAQQSRALMLVRALAGRGLLKKEFGNKNSIIDVGIVGGGLSGVTVAAALSILGCRVTIFEVREEILDLQKNASHRYIHPRIAEWPDYNSLRTDANLPLLNWRAGDAQKVLEDVNREFLKICGPQSRVRFQPTIKILHRVTKIDRQKHKVFVSGKTEQDQDDRKPFKHVFDLLIVAVGYGTDGSATVSLDGKTCYFPDNKGYWQHDDLGTAQEIGSDSDRRSVLIIGSGDGALIDLARVAIRHRTVSGRRDPDRMHGEMVERLAGEPLIRELGFVFRKIDEMIQREYLREGNVSTDLFLEYEKAFADFGRSKELKALVTSLGVERRWNVFFSPGSKVFGFTSLLLNRLLVFLLIKFDYVELIKYGKVVSNEVSTTTGRQKVTFKDGNEREYDVVIGRFGPPTEDLQPGEAAGMTRKVRIVGEIKGLENASKELGERLADLEVASHLDRSTYSWFTEQIRNLRRIQ